MTEIRMDEGEASVAMWDQIHADAMRMLRHARAFYLVAVEDGDVTPVARACSFATPVEGMMALLFAAAESAIDMGEDLASHEL